MVVGAVGCTVVSVGSNNVLFVAVTATVAVVDDSLSVVVVVVAVVVYVGVILFVAAKSCGNSECWAVVPIFGRSDDTSDTVSIQTDGNGVGRRRYRQTGPAVSIIVVVIYNFATLRYWTCFAADSNVVAGVANVIAASSQFSNFTIALFTTTAGTNTVAPTTAVFAVIMLCVCLTTVATSTCMCVAVTMITTNTRTSTLT